MKKRNYKSKIKITICVAIVIAFLGVSYIVKLYYPHDYGTTTGNFMNGQKMVEMDGDLYFFQEMTKMVDYIKWIKREKYSK